jgi:CheY-like chemotaxis protein
MIIILVHHRNINRITPEFLALPQHHSLRPGTGDATHLDPEVCMPVTVVLAVGLDSWKLTAQSAVLRSAGFIVIAANSIRDAIDHFRAGDFDLVLLDHSISNEDRERLSFLIRATGSQTPLACVAHHSGDSHSFTDATLKDDSLALLKCMGELVVRRATTLSAPAIA